MSDTRVLNQTLILGDDPDAIRLDIEDGHPFIVAGAVSIAVGQSSPAALTKLSEAAKRAAGLLEARAYADRVAKAVA